MTSQDGIEIIVSALILNESSEILLVRQPDKWGDLWTLPGGHLMPGELLQAGAQREGTEETGLDLAPVGLASFGELFQHRPSGARVHFIYFDFVFRAVTTTLKLERSEISEGRWVSPHDVLSYQLTDGYRDTLTKFLGRGGTSLPAPSTVY